ncbi:DUF3916 domain-containing protein [Listeria monocytogenes]|uniref:DUF3916 domain-containing protein n=1 Tax=Listeria monocytogenes TaxID=1639 RepID=UPI0010E2AC0F|nr:DUF3916 domain-containing protein [Listeria monocytogenes]EAD1643240.1 DUF3916 domain-containing protein [Listeria monocytogenes]EAD1646093.1 DUF3916 domain-containing protein [Listeria monocytogenes]EAD1661446.1 DUF3916 domain-containing protein [Listeria monocytogenes]EAF1403218.1 DUF3916 domain-containing protein [Listeria monocytogenes]ECB9715977.1 DUF3916 domain-containing protein [Listeria monocytogenes]
MREKKVRGIKRKSNNMIERIEAKTLEFPTEFYNGYWHLHLPVAQDFINSNKTPKKIKQLCIQTLLDRAEHLIGLKPDDKEKYRVVVAVDLADLWGSQIIVFKGDSHFKDFFNRNDEYQKWLNLPDNRNIQTEWGLSIPNDMKKSGFKEVITDEDGYHYEGEIWFIGELK